VVPVGAARAEVALPRLLRLEPTPDRYAGTRVIFVRQRAFQLDAGAGLRTLLLARFYAHQPDLNFDNPQVRQEMLDVVRFWLDLPASTASGRMPCPSCSSARERAARTARTHAYLRELRRVWTPTIRRVSCSPRPVSHPPTSWPTSDWRRVPPGVSFPAHARMFLAIRSEDATPLIDILQHTPAPPAGCQWADVSPQPRRAHAGAGLRRRAPIHAASTPPSRRCGLNFGIRRRLWPLLQGGRGRSAPARLLPAFPGVPSSTTATSSGWATTSGS